ncbi:MAG: hypothetical protein A3H45_05970 [Ignavibacteria bacterium RIFCSPLOWO2_02_FULL_55_14]|nr:MAG: hypothetical protein A3H45_05970 [Ignavibacteria bacterium RIFCSPLOWO2_02_FULL_55_14]
MSANFYRPPFFGGFSLFPPVIKMLFIINAGAFVLMTFFGSFRFNGAPLDDVLNVYFGLMPFGHGFFPWQLITYQFMHAGFWHLFFNMVFGLWMFGMEVENIWGARKFLIFYLMCGVVAGLAQLTLSPIFDPTQAIGPTVGASGSVYGVMVAFATMFPDREIFVFPLPVPVRVKFVVMFLIVMGVMSVGQQGNVANLAHLGGALAGYVFVVYDRGGFGSSSRVFADWKRTFTTASKRPSGNVVDAKVFDIHDGKPKPPTIEPDTQKKIDGILDKISQSGYQSLTEEEKKILFEASKKLN